MKRIFIVFVLLTAVVSADAYAEKKYFSNLDGITIDMPWKVKKVDTSDPAAIIIYEKDNLFLAVFTITDTYFTSMRGMRGILSSKIGCPAANITYHNQRATATGFVGNYGDYKVQGSIEYYKKNSSIYLFKILIEKYWSPSGDMLDNSSSDLRNCYFSIKP